MTLNKIYENIKKHHPVRIYDILTGFDFIIWYLLNKFYLKNSVHFLHSLDRNE